MKKYAIILCFCTIQLGSFAQLNTDRILSIGRNALYFEDYVLSIQYFNQIIRAKPYLPEPYMYRAIAKIQLGDFQGADDDSSEAIRLNPFVPQAFYTRGFARQRLGRHAEAVEDFSKALEFSPANEVFLMNKINARAMNQDYQAALTDLENYMQQNNKQPELLFEKGRLQMQLNDTIGAEQSFEHYLQLDSLNSSAWSARALLRLQKNDTEGALSDYNQAIKKKSNFAGDYINRGIIHVQKHNYKQALEDYNQAITLDKENSLAYYNRALLRNQLGDRNNALDDFDAVLRRDSSNTQALLQKAVLEQQLGNFTQAKQDYRIVLDRYPYFSPAYLALAEMEDKVGNTKQAFRYRKKAYDIETEKKKEEKQQAKALSGDNKIETGGQQSASRRRSEFFNRFAAQNLEDKESGEEKYAGTTRGSIQHRYVELSSERNFVLSYYAKVKVLCSTPLYHIEVDNYNRSKQLASNLKITNEELALTQELIDMHFRRINELSQHIQQQNSADLYFARAIEFALVQDFSAALEDLNKAITLRPDFIPAYFTRANIRYKSIESSKMSKPETHDASKERDADKPASETQYKYDVELIMRDYDKVNQISPYPFPYAYFNKANILGGIRDFQSAIVHYSKAIEAEAYFAEAYFNRGLTYLYIGEEEKGLADLSKAGELGLSKAYNLITRYKK